jgi:hypothetical protein
MEDKSVVEAPLAITTVCRRAASTAQGCHLSNDERLELYIFMNQVSKDMLSSILVTPGKLTLAQLNLCNLKKIHTVID